MQDIPFTECYELNHDLRDLDLAAIADTKRPTLRMPGQPQFVMSDSERIQSFLFKDLGLKDLDVLASRLWMMSKQDSGNITPLHRQRVKNREIIITEDPRLHLIWYHDRIFIKPLPKYLLSYRFWQAYLPSHCSPGSELDSLRKTTLGYLRTYFYLIRHESDFLVATDEKLQLLPSGTKFIEFVDFASRLEGIINKDVAPRYSYGEIRLSRLNFYSKIFLGKWNFQRVNRQYSDYFASFYGPILFAFAVFSTFLNAMQVELTVETLDEHSLWKGFWYFCRYFSVLCVATVGVLILWMGSLLFYKIVKEWEFALKDRRTSKQNAKKMEDE
jgi:hypothetical protein